MPLYLGIDAGGTKTDCAVSNGAELLGQATGASCKLARVGKERGRENLQAVIRQATRTAHVDTGRIQHVCIGMAGVMTGLACPVLLLLPADEGQADPAREFNR